MREALLTMAALVAVALLVNSPAEAQSNSWRTVGYKTVSGRDSDTIRLQGDRRDRQIRICAFNAPIRMRDLDVRFENGKKQDIEVRNRINPGTCTRNIDLAGDRRNIHSVHLRYEPIFRTADRPLIRVQAR